MEERGCTEESKKPIRQADAPIADLPLKPPDVESAGKHGHDGNPDCLECLHDVLGRRLKPGWE